MLVSKRIFRISRVPPFCNVSFRGGLKKNKSPHPASSWKPEMIHMFQPKTAHHLLVSILIRFRVGVTPNKVSKVSMKTKWWCFRGKGNNSQGPWAIRSHWWWSLFCCPSSKHPGQDPKGPKGPIKGEIQNFLVVSTRWKNISQIGSFPQVRAKIKNIRNHQPENCPAFVGMWQTSPIQTIKNL